MSRHNSNPAHLETEKGFRISQSEYRLLRLSLLPSIGFSFLKKSQIADFVVPTQSETTRRIRIERIEESADGLTGLHCLRCFKNHPIKGAKGQHVRQEKEVHISASNVLALIMREIEKLGAPVPHYTKKRWYFQGLYEGYRMTVLLDRAVGLGQFSGCYMEIETILPLDSDKVTQALGAIERLAHGLLGESRPSKISYRKMLMTTWTHGAMTPAKLRQTKVNYRKLVRRITATRKQSLKQAASNSKPSGRTKATA